MMNMEIDKFLHETLVNGALDRGDQALFAYLAAHPEDVVSYDIEPNREDEYVGMDKEERTSTVYLSGEEVTLKHEQGLDTQSVIQIDDDGGIVIFINFDYLHSLSKKAIRSLMDHHSQRITQFKRNQKQ